MPTSEGFATEKGFAVRSSPFAVPSFRSAGLQTVNREPFMVGAA
jgi:hypothetical protein